MKYELLLNAIAMGCMNAFWFWYLLSTRTRLNATTQEK